MAPPRPSFRRIPATPRVRIATKPSSGTNFGGKSQGCDRETEPASSTAAATASSVADESSDRSVGPVGVAAMEQAAVCPLNIYNVCT